MHVDTADRRVLDRAHGPEQECRETPSCSPAGGHLSECCLPDLRSTVWFFRNKQGGCAYFDAIGKPCPLDPCLNCPSPLNSWTAATIRSAYDDALRRGRDDRWLRDALRETRRLEGCSGRVSRVSRWTLQWWHIIAILCAAVLSVPCTWSFISQLDGSARWFAHWIMSVPTIGIVAACIWYFARVEPPPFTTREAAAIIVGTPIALITGMVGNVLTLGLAVPAVSCWIICDANRLHGRSGRR